MLYVINSLGIVLIVLVLFFKEKEKYFTLDKKIIVVEILQSMVIAFGVGFAIWRFEKGKSQVFTEFISGNVAFDANNKTADYFGLYGAIVLFFIMFYLLSKNYLILLRNGISTKDLSDYSLLSLAPFMMMVGNWLKNKDTTFLLVISVISIVLFSLVMLFTNYLLRLGYVQDSNFLSTSFQFLLLILFTVFSGLGFMILANRASIFGLGKEIFSAWIGVFLILLFFLLSRGMNYLLLRLNKILTFSQVGIPLLFLSLLPPPVITIQGSLERFEYRPLFYIMLLFLIAFTYYRIYKKNYSKEQTLPTLSVLIAILVYFSVPIQQWPSISVDDYHAGEFYLPWW